MEKNGKSSKNNLLFAQSKGISSNSGESNNGRVVRKIQSRNPFFHYLNAYRKTVRNYPRSIWSVTAAAAKRWNEMPMHEKCIYIDKARHTLSFVGSLYAARSRSVAKSFGKKSDDIKYFRNGDNYRTDTIVEETNINGSFGNR